jgi:hypothetical protein
LEDLVGAAGAFFEDINDLAPKVWKIWPHGVPRARAGVLKPSRSHLLTPSKWEILFLRAI